MPGLRRALFERGLDFSERNAARFEQHQQMIEKISRLGDQAPFIFLHRGETCLDGLLTQFLGAVSDALVEECAGIGIRSARFGALVHPLFQIGKGEFAHGCLFGRLNSIVALRDRAASADLPSPYGP